MAMLTLDEIAKRIAVIREGREFRASHGERTSWQSRRSSVLIAMLELGEIGCQEVQVLFGGAEDGWAGPKGKQRAAVLISGLHSAGLIERSGHGVYRLSPAGKARAEADRAARRRYAVGRWEEQENVRTGTDGRGGQAGSPGE